MGMAAFGRLWLALTVVLAIGYVFSASVPSSWVGSVDPHPLVAGVVFVAVVGGVLYLIERLEFGALVNDV